MLKILIADDEKPIRQWFEYVIQQYPDEFRIVGLCSNGRQALELFERERPDIIITDIRMPVMDGLELIREVRQRGASTMFLVLSNYDNFEYVKKGFVFGAKDYLLKGETDDAEIVSTLRKLCAEMEEAAHNEKEPDAYETLLSTLLKQLDIEPSHWRKVRACLNEDCQVFLQQMAHNGAFEHPQVAREAILQYLSWIALHFCNNHVRYSESTNVIIDHLWRNYADKLEMKQLAELVHLHENYISQLFRKDTGQPVTQFLLEIRMLHARLLLHMKKHKINEIAKKTGYHNEAHFSTTFKGFFGKSPSQYL